MKFEVSPLKKIWLYLGVTLVMTGCDSLWKEKDPEALARVGENYLYREDVARLMTDAMSEEDSASFVTEYINNWASNQLMLEKARINLPEKKLAEFDDLVSNYRTDLYTRAYKEALVQKGSDSSVTREQLETFYEREKENFRLGEMLAKLRFVALPKDFINKVEVAERLKNFGDKDQVVLDSISVQFRKKNFNDSVWVTASRLLEEIPPLTVDNIAQRVKESEFLNLEDDSGVYLAKILEVKEINEIAPLSFIEPQIEQVLLNRRRLDYLRNLQTDIIDEAIQKNEFELFIQNKNNTQDKQNEDEEE